MESLKTLLAREGYYVVSYRDFCVNKQNNPNTVNNRIKQLQAEIKDKFVIFIDWEHERVLKTLVSYHFVGFDKILGSYYNTRKWAISVPTFGHDNFAPRQINNLDFFIYVNKFNQNFDVSKIDHSIKSKDFLYLNGKPHLFRVQLLKELLHQNLLQNRSVRALCGSLFGALLDVWLELLLGLQKGTRISASESQFWVTGLACEREAR